MGVSTILYVLAFASAFLAMRSILDFGRDVSDKSLVNDRLKVREKTETVSEAVVELRRKRGLDEFGESRLSNKWFNTLVTKSGLTYRPAAWALGAVLAGLVVAGGIYFKTSSILFSGIGFALVTPLLPLFMLKRYGNKRDRLLGEQLPEGLEIIVRSLQAGHPVPTAVALVGRELPDPCGSEFGMVADEVSYGSSLAEAVRKLAERTGHPDVGLFAATIRLQARTGGNLASLLATNAHTIRQRMKMRMKVKAASSEGRMSATILTSAPFVMLVAMHLMTPDFYGDVIDEPLIRWGIGGAFAWMMVGNYVMRQMIKFKV